MDLAVVPLHKYPEYKEECCSLINDEWRRSVTARMMSLDNSCDTLPTCLILLQESRVIGHCKLSLIPSIPDGCFIESVVIHKSLRGKGYGTYLMQKAEDYCKTFLNLKTIYLSTKDQQGFYSKLGYSICNPISIYGKTNIPNFQLTSSTNKSINNCPIPPPMPSTAFNVTSKVYMEKQLQ